MKKLLVTLLSITCFDLISQIDSSGAFIKFNSGKILYGEKVIYEPHMINSKVRLDGSPYRSTELVFFRDEHGAVYGNLNGFTRSIGNGRGVYFFSASASMQSTQSIPGTGVSKTTTSTRVKFFYSENFGEIKRVNFSNFQHKMQDDSVSKHLIHMAGRARGVSFISYAVFGTTIALNFVLLGNKSYTESNAVFVSGGVALGSIITAIVYNRIKLKRTQKAIDKYYGVYVPIGE